MYFTFNSREIARRVAGVFFYAQSIPLPVNNVPQFRSYILQTFQILSSHSEITRFSKVFLRRATFQTLPAFVLLHALLISQMQ